MKTRDTLRLIFNIWLFLRPVRKTQLFYIFLLMLLASTLELISIGAIIPFLAVLVNPISIVENENIYPLLNILDIKHSSNLTLLITLIFCALVIISGIIRLLLLWLSTKFSFEVGADISEDIYRKTLYQDYITHISRNSSEIINGIFLKVGSIITGALMPLLTMASSFVVGISIFAAMCFFGSWWAIMACLIFAIFYLLVNFLTKSRLVSNSNLIANQSTNMIQNLQESLSGIRDVILDGTQEIYIADYVKSDRIFRAAQSSNVFIGSSPRFIIESCGIVLIATLAYLLLALGDEGIGIIPILGVLALGAQRLLPIFQQFYGGLTALQGSYGSFMDAVELLEQPLPKNIYGKKSAPPITFNESLELRAISFKHKYASSGLQNINIKILKGERIGIIGETGSGKSTLLDLIMGLLKPNTGYINIDSVRLGDENIFAWHKRLAHVPQNIHISDASIAENIAFGVPVKLIDLDRVMLVSRLARIHDEVVLMRDGYKTLVGERGVSLSGGQRQRIGIARALYKGADVIILDEATSALDQETEDKVMESIYSLGNEKITLLIVAHRTSTLKSCGRIIEVKNGSIFEVA